jgi:hypothetical protein
VSYFYRLNNQSMVVNFCDYSEVADSKTPETLERATQWLTQLMGVWVLAQSQ